MGSGNSKGNKGNGADLVKANGGSRERRPSHVDTNPPAKSDVLVECPHCGRNFASDRIGKHAEVCARSKKSRRKVFDVQGQRLEGTEAEEFRDEFNEMDVTRSAGEWKDTHEKMLKNLKRDRRRSSRARPMSAMDNIDIRI